MAIAKPPLTVKKLKSILDFLKYYDISEKECLECMVKYKDIADFYREHREYIIKRRKNVLRLFDYCENDFDRELLQRRYVYCEDYYNIAYSMAYSERMIYRYLKKALERLAENTKNIAEFEY